MDFERAQDALRISRPQPRRYAGVDQGELFVQRLRRQAFGIGADAGADFLRDFWNIGQALGQRLEIHAGAADEDRRPLGATGLGQGAGRIFKPAADRIVHGPVHVAEQHMRRLRLLVWRWSGRDDAQVGINLHGISVDDDPVEVARQTDRQRGLAAGRRACNEDG